MRSAIRAAVQALVGRASDLVQRSGLRAVAEAVRAPLATVGRLVKRVMTGDASRPVGRPPKPVTEADREAVRSAVRESAGKVAVAQLRGRFPGLARSVLRQEARSVRQQLRKVRRAAKQIVGWLRVGAVWAMDHTKVEGCDALCVRDLTSTKVLHGDLGPNARAGHVVDVLRGLFERWGAPLAIKCDNGSAFVSASVRALLEEWGILPIYSPPACPEYNGAAECGIRWLKETALDLAQVQGGSPGDLLVDAARVLNAQVKRGAKASPDQRWAGRCAITPTERRRMHRLVAAARIRITRTKGIAEHHLLPHALASAVDRHAIPAALTSLGVMTIQRP